MQLKPDEALPTEIVLHPSWWNKHEGIVFDRDYFFHPVKRVEEERHMERALYERWGRYGLGADHDHNRPSIGPVHLAAGFLISGMMGCEVVFQEDGSPQLKPIEKDISSLNEDDPFQSGIFKDFSRMVDSLRLRFGYLTGDVDWNGILNNSLDLYGQNLFLEFWDRPDEVKKLFQKVARIQERFFSYIYSLTGSTSTAVNRSVRHFSKPILLHSQCSHTMISELQYREFLLPFDIDWADRFPPYGIHFCGSDLERFIASYREIIGLEFLDVGWGSDIIQIREAFPDVFLNIRLNPAELVHYSPARIKDVISMAVKKSGDIWKTGICCINIDSTAADQQIDAIFQSCRELRHF